MEKVTIDINQKTILIVIGVLIVLFLAFFAGRYNMADKSKVSGQEINKNSIQNQPTAPSAGGGCGV